VNCNPGDMAMVINSVAGNTGKMVTCVRLLTCLETIMVADTEGPVWLIDSELNWRHVRSGVSSPLPWCPDRKLLPIRPDGEVETREEDLTLEETT